jgi:hypothetical protein
VAQHLGVVESHALRLRVELRPGRVAVCAACNSLLRYLVPLAENVS